MNKENNIYNVLSNMQKTLKAPKNQYNNFGKYKYRSCEDILEGVKAILPEGYSLTINDEVVYIGNRYYVRSVATLKNSDDAISNCAYAREEETKRGMDGSQITGASSSYARKYALNGLFAIDDTKDADSQEPSKDKPAPKPEIKPLSGEEFLMIQNGLKNASNADELKTEWLKFNQAKSRMTPEQVSTLTKNKDAKKIELENKEMDGSDE